MYRKTVTDYKFNGCVIPAGKLVLVMIGSANRDPAQFKDPNRFNIRRDPNPHVAFGHGIHFCLGAALARLEARIALSQFLERAQGFRSVNAKDWEPRKGLHVLGPTNLPITFARSSEKVLSSRI